MIKATQTKIERSETAPGLKILLYDVESLPNVSYTWGTWQQDVIKVKERRIVCSIAWQWYHEGKTKVMALPDFDGYDPLIRDNLKLIKAFKGIRAKADVVIGHNLDRFDTGMVNTDMFLRHIKPHAGQRSIDTLAICKTKFRLNSNRLGDVCGELGIGKKVPHPGFPMWEGCMAGKKKSWDQMKKYNVGDVDPLLRGLYEHLRPWMTNHPNMAIETAGLRCPRCRSYQYKFDGTRNTQTSSYRKILCLDCRSWGRGIMVRGRMVWRPHS